MRRSIHPSQIDTPNGVMGVPSNDRPFAQPLIPYGSTALPPNAPVGTNVSTYWDTNTVWAPLKDGTTYRGGYGGLTLRLLW